MHIWSIKGNVSGNLILIRKVAICAKLQENRKVLKYIGIDFTAKNFHFCQNETLHNAEFLWQLSNLQTSVKKLSQNIWFPPSPPPKKEKLLYDWQRKKNKKTFVFYWNKFRKHMFKKNISLYHCLSFETFDKYMFLKNDPQDVLECLV